MSDGKNKKIFGWFLIKYLYPLHNDFHDLVVIHTSNQLCQRIKYIYNNLVLFFLCGYVHPISKGVRTSSSTTKQWDSDSKKKLFLKNYNFNLEWLCLYCPAHPTVNCRILEKLFNKCCFSRLIFFHKNKNPGCFEKKMVVLHAVDASHSARFIQSILLFTRIFEVIHQQHQMQISWMLLCKAHSFQNLLKGEKYYENMISFPSTSS